MAVIRTSEARLEFPVVGFSEDHGLLCFDDLDALTICPSIYVEDQSWIGMELIDNSQRRWIVRALHLETPLVKRRWWQILNPPCPRFDLDLEAVAPIDLDDLKHRFLEESELEHEEDERAVRKAPDLAGMIDASNMQGSGLL